MKKFFSKDQVAQKSRTTLNWNELLDRNPLATAALLLFSQGVPINTVSNYRKDLHWEYDGDRAYPRDRNTALAVLSQYGTPRYEGKPLERVAVEMLRYGA